MKFLPVPLFGPSLTIFPKDEKHCTFYAFGAKQQKEPNNLSALFRYAKIEDGWKEIWVVESSACNKPFGFTGLYPINEQHILVIGGITIDKFRKQEEIKQLPEEGNISDSEKKTE